MQKVPPEISVVILCYRAEDIVPKFVAEMKNAIEAQGLTYELVLVANYHKDNIPLDRTPEIVRRMSAGDPTLTVVAKVKEGMMGWDMRSGLEAASGKTIAVIDGDGQMPVADVIRVYRALKSGDFDMAKTYRIERGDGTKRIFISRIYNVLLKLLFPKVKVMDANSKPKIFTREAYDRLCLTTNRWFVDAEIMIQAAHHSFKIAEIPTVFHINTRRASFVKISSIVGFVFDMLRYRIFWRPNNAKK